MRQDPRTLRLQSMRDSTGGQAGNAGTAGTARKEARGSMATPGWIIGAAVVAAVLFFLMNYVMFRVGHRLDERFRQDDLGNGHGPDDEAHR